MNNSPFLIYPIGESDVDVLRDLAILTFGETFSESNSPENMENYYSRCFNRETLTRELRDPEAWWYFIESKGKVCGYLKVNTGQAQTELREKEGFEVERIYVLQEYHGKGIGTALMDFAIQRCRELEKSYIWLGVHEENYRALSFYEKYGFRQFSEHVFMMGKQPQRDLLLRKEIRIAPSGIRGSCFSK